MNRVVVATSETALAGGGERLLQLVGWLRRRGVSVEILALGEGWDLDRFRATGPTVVVDELRRTGIARPIDLIGLDGVAAGLKSLRLRAWLRRRRRATFFIQHPVAASVLRYDPVPGRHVVAGLPDATWSLDDVRPEDRATLGGASAWVVVDAVQQAALEAELDVPVRILGHLVDPSDFPAVPDASPGDGTVALLGPSDPWSTPDHAVEIAWQFHRARPAAAIRWLVADDRAAWLARHDLHHAGLVDAVDVVTPSDPSALAGLGVLVRTGIEPTAEQELMAVALAGVPVLDLARPASEASPALEALDVEGLVGRLVELHDDPAAAAVAGKEGADRLPVASFDHRAQMILDLLRPG